MKTESALHSSNALLHPITLIALALWVINDHLLKGWGPGVLTGKLSDVAGLMVSPTVLLGILEWCAPGLLRRHRRAALAASCAAIGALLVGLELSSAVELAYQHVLGSAQFVARGLIAWLSGGAPAAYALVHTTPDVTDLLTLPALAVPWWLGCRGQGGCENCRKSPGLRRGRCATGFVTRCFQSRWGGAARRGTRSSTCCALG